MSIATIRLSEAAEINPRMRFHPPADTPVSFLGMADVDAENGTTSPGEERPFGSVSKGYTQFENGDVLVAKITPCFENSKIAQAKLGHPLGAGSTEFHVIRPNHEKLDSRFLLRFLRQPYVRIAGEMRMTGSAGQRRVPGEFLSNLPIPFLPVDEQRKIAHMLDRVDALRAKRRKAIALLDDLAQSIFLDMFGDPNQALKGSDGVALGSVTEIQTGPFGSLLHQDDYIDNGIPLVNPMHMVNGTIVPDYAQSVKLSKAKSLASFRMKIGDIVLSRRGEMGRCAVVHPEQEGFICGTGSLIVRPKLEIISSIYLAAVLSHPSTRRHLERISLGTTMPNLNQTIVGSLRIRIPPRTTQQSFEDHLSKIAREESLNRKHLNELDALFGSVQERAFRGELGKGLA